MLLSLALLSSLAPATPPGPIPGSIMKLEVVGPTGNALPEAKLRIHLDFVLDLTEDDHTYEQQLWGEPPWEVPILVGGNKGAYAEVQAIADGFAPSAPIRIEGEAFHKRLAERVDAEIQASREGRELAPAPYLLEHRFVLQPLPERMPGRPFTATSRTTRSLVGLARLDQALQGGIGDGPCDHERMAVIPALGPARLRAFGLGFVPECHRSTRAPDGHMVVSVRRTPWSGGPGARSRRSPGSNRSGRGREAALGDPRD